MLTILGAGPAGLAAADEAVRRGHACRVFEAAPRIGGNCSTFSWGRFRYDSGAHRFHARDEGVTARIMALLGDELRRVEAPSQICTRAGFVTFPLQAARLPRQLGLAATLASAWDYVRRPRGDAAPADFETLALRAYGRRLSELFLLGYSEKLWGVPCHGLSPEIAGNRLRGLDLRAVLPRFGRRPTHMEGEFYYPRGGYGRICDRLAEAAGAGRIRTGAPVTRLLHNGRRITRVEIARQELLDVDAVCSTLPAGLAMKLLHPAVEPALLELAGSLRYRHVVLVAVFLARPSVSPNASLYFPEADVPFTRVVEPRNRSADMAPEGQTSLVAEVPCFASDPVWNDPDEAIVDRVVAGLASYGLISAAEVIGAEVRRLPHAYPVLEAGVEDRVREVLRFFDRFENLVVTGRNGRFVYRHLHDMVRFGADAVRRLEAAGELPRRTSYRATGQIASPAAGPSG